MLTNRWFLSVFAALALSCATHAAPITVFNTGVNNAGVPLPNGTPVDPHYTLTLPGGVAAANKVLTSAGGFPIGPWLGDDTLSAWIGPNTDQADGPAVNYDYQTTFDLTGLDPATAFLTGRWSTDNTGVNIFINHVSTGITAAGPDGGDPIASFEQWTTFSIGSGFHGGVNTLDFIVNNAPYAGTNPTGLRVELAGTAAEAPEPASLVLLGAGLVVLSKLRRRVRIS